MPATTANPAPPVRTPPTDLLTHDTSLSVIVDLPGVQSDDLRVRLERGILFIEADARAPDGSIRVRNRRALALRRKVDEDAIQAHLKHGVLRLELPRKEEDQPRTIPILEN